MPGARGVAAKEYFIKIITALSLLHVQMLFGSRFTEYRQTPTKAILATKGCLSECHAILANDAKPKVETGFSSCFLLCLKRAKVADRQGLTGPTTFLIVKKRIRKSIFKNDECHSPNQTLDWYPSETDVNFGKYENTSNWYINVSWTPMNDVNETWSGIFIRLALEPKDGFMSDFYCALLPKNQTVLLHGNISSYGYTYPDRIYLRVIGFPFVSDDYDIFPFAPPTPPIKILEATATTSSQAPVPTDLTAVIVPAVIGILIGLALVAGFIKYFLCHKRRQSLPEGFEYDAFIIYSQLDQLWISERLLPLLEERNELKCCIHYRDFEPGKVFYDSMAEYVYKSFKIIAVLSNNFFDSNYCSYELNIAKYRLLNAMDDSLIMVRIDNVDREKLPRKLQKRSFIDYFNPLERPFWEKKLLQCLDAPNDEYIDKSAATLAY